MSRQYEVFYCLERVARKLVVTVMERAAGNGWWTSGRVPQKVIDEAATLMLRERDAGVTPRSSSSIDYTTFWHLSVIITSNWDVFEPVFPRTSKSGISKVMNSLNALRGPIAHCCHLSKHEAERFNFSVRDWLEAVS